MDSSKLYVHGMKNYIKHSFILVFSSKYDNYLFVYNHHSLTLYVLVYVNDILIIGSSSNLIHELINKLHSKFALKKLGVPKYFLGIEVHHQDNDTLLLIEMK